AVAAKPKREIIDESPDKALVDEIQKTEAKFIAANIFDPDKAKRESAMSELISELTAKYKEKYKDEPAKLRNLGAAVGKAVDYTIR
ncbi:hypothetical protein ABTM04_20775, partial [Acinetobacter baumannii]